MLIQGIITCIFLLIAAALSYLLGKLTLPGAMTGFVVALLIYKGAGYTGIATLALFFIAGSWATTWKISDKKAIGFAEQNKGRRTAGQVLANGGVAALLGAIGWLHLLPTNTTALLIAGSLAAAMADTLSSELGTVYGFRFINVLTFKKDERGLDGVISLEGTLIGAIGAGLIAVVYCIGFGWSWALALIVCAGIIGNLADSVLGATLERRGMIGNNMVNFLNTFCGAMVCWLLSYS